MRRSPRFRPFRRFRWARLAPWLLVGLVGCGPSERVPAVRARSLAAPVLLVAVDALEPDVVLPLLAQGELENLARLIREGTWGVLRTRKEARSPRIWTTIATGQPPARHGITGFTYEGPDGERRLFTSEDRRTKAFWNVLGDFGIESATIGWWVTFPAEPVLGLMVAQTNTLEDRAAGLYKGALHEGVAGQVHPEARTAWVLASLRASEAALDERLAAIFGPETSALEGEPAER